MPSETGVPSAQGNETDPPVVQSEVASRSGSGDGWIELRVWAEMLRDAQAARIACTNRVERGGIDSAYFKPQLASLAAAEHEIELSLHECYRRIVPKPIRDWQKATVGIGEHSLARLLGQIGNPAVAHPKRWVETPGGKDKRVLVDDAPYERSLRQFWAYCGHGDPARKRAKGMEQQDALAMGSPVCKMIVHYLLARKCIGIGGPIGEKGHYRRPGAYRGVYEARRLATADRVDAAGEPWTIGHQDNDAIRIVGKEILRDLWLASRGEA
jgi:hypothetical protein